MAEKPTPDPHLLQRVMELDAFAKSMGAEVERRTPQVILKIAQDAALNNPKSPDLFVAVNNLLEPTPSLIVLAANPRDSKESIAVPLTAMLVVSGLTGVPTLFALLEEPDELHQAIAKLGAAVELNLNAVRVVSSPETSRRWGRRGYQRWDRGLEAE